MGDNLIDPKDEELEGVEGEINDDFDDELILGDKKSKKKSSHEDDESLDALAEEELDEVSDSYDDEDLW